MQVFTFFPLAPAGLLRPTVFRMDFSRNRQIRMHLNFRCSYTVPENFLDKFERHWRNADGVKKRGEKKNIYAYIISFFLRRTSKTSPSRYLCIVLSSERSTFLIDHSIPRIERLKLIGLVVLARSSGKSRRYFLGFEAHIRVIGDTRVELHNVGKLYEAPDRMHELELVSNAAFT